MTDADKQAVAQHSVQYALDHDVIGIGTGSTVDAFIAALANAPHRLQGAVTTSTRSAALLQQHGIPVLSLNATGTLPVYIDGADEVNAWGYCIKGGGGALTQEKIVASASQQFVCMVTAQKMVTTLGAFPLAIEVLDMARSYVARQILAMGGDPVYREGFVTDNGHVILDVYGLDLADAAGVSSQLNHIAGVVAHGLFVQTPAQIIVVGEAQGVVVHNAKPSMASPTG